MSIYKKYIEYNNFRNFKKNFNNMGDQQNSSNQLSSFSNNSYSYLFYVKNDIINYNNLNDIYLNNPTIKNNFEKWQKYIDKEDKLNKLNALFNILDSKNNVNNRKRFYERIIDMLINNLDNISENIIIHGKNDTKIINAIIKIFLCDKKNILKIGKYVPSKKCNEFIDKLIKNIFLLLVYEIKISESFSNTKYENNLSELLNSYVILFEILGENYNKSFHEIIFTKREYNFIDLLNYKNEKRKEKTKYVIYEILLEFHRIIFLTLYNSYEINQNNLLIIFHSLTQCIIEYSNTDNIEHNKIISNSLLKYNQNLYKEFEGKRKLFISKKKNNQIFKQYYDSIIDNEKVIFLFKNYLLIQILYIKRVNILKYPLVYIYDEIYTMYYFFIQILDKIVNNSENKNISIEVLLDKYKNNKFYQIQLFSLVLLYYEKLYYINRRINSDELNILINIRKKAKTKIEEKNMQKAKDLINSKYNVENVDTDKMITMFKFLNKIFDFIEINMDGKTKFILNLRSPFDFHLSKIMKKYYFNSIDRS